MDSTRSNAGSRATGEPALLRFVASTPVGPGWRRALSTLRTRAEPPRRDREVVLDSFDRRLRKAGLGLTAHGEAPRVVCRLRARVGAPRGVQHETVQLDTTVQLETLPRFAWDFPHEQALELARALEAREVEPIGTHELELERWAVLDEHEKVVAWIDEERHRVRAAHLADDAAPVLRVALRGVRGYAPEFQAVARELERSDGLRVCDEGPFDPASALAPAAPEPGRWPRLARRVSAYRGLARIARAQIEVFAANEARIRPGADAEHLHDARIALRRLRSLIGQLEGVLAPDAALELGAELRWLAGALGPARDLDTLLFELRLSELCTELAPALQRLEHERERLYREVRAELDSQRQAALRERLRVVFDARPRSAAAGPKAAQPFVQVLARRLRRRLRQVVASAARVEARAPSVELHELRIACKKLRYLLECCRGLAPQRELALAFADLKGLQGTLGTIQDARVHAELLDTLSTALFPAIGARAGLALGRFQERTLQRGRGACARYVELRDAFLAPASQARFRALLRDLARGARTP